jgi:multiple sugar transport system substrate-binding protein
MGKRTASIIIVLILIGTGIWLFAGSGKKEQTAGKEQVVVKIWDWHIAQQPVYEKEFEKFMKENPGIKIEHNVISQDQYDNMIQLAFKSGETPDIFLLPSSVKAPEAIEKGWVQPLDPYIENTDWVKRFPANSFSEGSNKFEGKIYSFPTTAPGLWMIFPLYYNQKLFTAGLAAPPKTWDELRDYAKKLTAVGNGKSYGFIMGGKGDYGWDLNMKVLANAAGTSPHHTMVGFDFRTGQYDFTHPGFAQAYELLDNIRKDGSFFPGFMALDDEQARAYFATDRAAMIVGGVWNIAGWDKYPNAEYGIAPIPYPGQRKGKFIHGLPGGYQWFFSAKSKNQEAVWKVMDFLSSVEFSRACVEGGLLLSVFPEANTDLKNAKMLALSKLADETSVLGPQPYLRNSNTSLVDRYKSKAAPIKTTFPRAVLNAWTGKVPLTQGLKQATKEYNAQFNEAIALAQKNGLKVSREDFVYSDFNILQDYPVAKLTAKK